jgi:hypothetical protein
MLFGASRDFRSSQSYSYIMQILKPQNMVIIQNMQLMYHAEKEVSIISDKAVAHTKERGSRVRKSSFSRDRKRPIEARRRASQLALALAPASESPGGRS